MAIAEEKYKELKPYWDFQRKLEYNRELLRKQIVNVQTKYNFNHPEMSPDDMFTLLWDKITQKDLETPPKTWVPENDEFKLWNELKHSDLAFVFSADFLAASKALVNPEFAFLLCLTRSLYAVLNGFISSRINLSSFAVCATLIRAKNSSNSERQIKFL